jgi:CPA1 family monovalent cation:H+ antiporter
VKPWQIVGLVAAGMVAGGALPGGIGELLRAATLYVLLPALLFEAAWHLNVSAAARMWRPILVLAVPVVVATAAIVAGALMLAGMPAGSAFLTGAILSATDPIAVLALLRSAGVAAELAAVLESESLFNDAVAVVLYTIALSAILAGNVNAGTVAAIALRGFAGAGAGVALGIALAWIAALALRRTGAAFPHVLATMVLAYGSYFVAARLSLSGIFATIAAGIALHVFQRSRLTRTADEDVDRVWRLCAIAADVAVFALLGAALPAALASLDAWPIVVAVVAVAAARLLTSQAFRLAGWPKTWRALLQSAGMRGPLSGALALALPAAVSQRGTITAAVFVSVLATIALAGLTLGPAAKRASGGAT